METSNANPFCWATAESLSTVSASTDFCGAGEATVSKVGTGEAEREDTGEMALSRNVPGLMQDLCHVEAEQEKR